MYTRIVLTALALSLATSVGNAAGVRAGGGHGGGHGGGFKSSGVHRGGPSSRGRHVGFGFDGNFGGGFGGQGYDWAYWAGVGGLYNGLNMYNDYRPPYFSVHPPVYYSYPVPRTYGYSPFAYPPGVMTPEFVGEFHPLEISNPYVPKQNESEAKSDPAEETVSQPDKEKTVEPLVIHNPYVTDNDALVNAGR